MASAGKYVTVNFTANCDVAPKSRATSPRLFIVLSSMGVRQHPGDRPIKGKDAATNPESQVSQDDRALALTASSQN